MVERMGTDFMTKICPFAQFGNAHTVGARNANLLVPEIEAADLVGHEIVRGGEAKLLQHGQGITEHILETVVKRDDGDFALFPAVNVRNCVPHRQAAITQPFQPGHLLAKAIRVHDHTAIGRAVLRWHVNLMIQENRNRHGKPQIAARERDFIFQR